MRLSRIELPAFGCLSDFRTELTPGLNLFIGPNEAGKSTLQQAVLALLYGFYDRDRAGRDETLRHRSFRPWSGGDFRGLLEYELDDGRRFQVRRDFSTGDVPTQLIDLTTGKDVAGEIGQGRHGNIPFARRHLGMSRAVFQRCAFISQGEIFEDSRGASPREIGDAIASLADSARRDVSAANAVQRLKDLIGKIGTDRARTADLPRAREHLHDAQQELQALESARRTIADEAAEADRLQHRLTEIEAEIGRAEVLLTQAQISEIGGRLQDLSDADRAIGAAQARQAELKRYATVPAHLRGEVQTLSGRRETAVAAIERLQAQLATARSPLTEQVRLEYAALQSDVGSLSLDELQAIERLAYTQPVRDRGLVASVLGAMRAAGRALARVVRGVIRLVLRRKAAAPPERPASPPPPAATQAEAAHLLEKHRRYLTLQPKFDNCARLEEEESRASADLKAIDGQLRGLVGDAAASSGEELHASITAFINSCDGREKYEEALAAEEQVSKRRRALLGGRSPQELERRHEQLTGNLQRLLSRFPELQGSESEQTRGELADRADALREEREQVQLKHARLKAAISQAFTQHRPQAEIEEEIDRWQREVSQLEGARAAAQMATDAIEEAVTEVYRNFAPRVNEFLSRGIDFVTGGRYIHAYVDPSTLQISLDVPQIDQVVSNPPVSHGTRTLIYVLMRIGLAQHMSSIGEPVPLVLDDPFVDIDDQRLPRLLDFLARLSGERGIQILLFSKDAQTLRWFQDRAGEPQHHLHQLPSVDGSNDSITPAVANRRLQ